jgi:hypothetical protein
VVSQSREIEMQGRAWEGKIMLSCQSTILYVLVMASLAEVFRYFLLLDIIALRHAPVSIHLPSGIFRDCLLFPGLGIQR